MSRPRWDRLTQSLAAAGVRARVDERPYAESLFGRVSHGTDCSIFIKLPGGAVEIDDAWWSKNPQVWIGWQVSRCNTEGIVKHSWAPTKKRSEVVAHVLAALGQRGADPHAETEE